MMVIICIFVKFISLMHHLIYRYVVNTLSHIVTERKKSKLSYFKATRGYGVCPKSSSPLPRFVLERLPADEL